MDTINKDAAPVTGIVPLGTIRRNNRTIVIQRDADEANGTRFTLAVFGDDEPELILGIVTIFREADAPKRGWLPAAKALRINEVVESGIIKCLRALARAIVYGETVPAWHGFVKDAACPYPFGVEDVEPWKA